MYPIGTPEGKILKNNINTVSQNKLYIYIIESIKFKFIKFSSRDLGVIFMGLTPETKF